MTAGSLQMARVNARPSGLDENSVGRSVSGIPLVVLTNLSLLQGSISGDIEIIP